MHFSSTVVAVAALAVGARADLDFNINDTPGDCRDICRPMDQLHQTCDADDEAREADCFCTNESFQVAQVAAHCQDCIRQAIDEARANASSGGGDGGGGDNKAIEGSECRENDQCESGSCVDNFCVAAGGAARFKGKRQAIDGSDCQDSEQCRSGFCAEMPGRVNRVCQNPNGGGEEGGEEEDEEEEEEEDENDGANEPFPASWLDAQDGKLPLLPTSCLNHFRPIELRTYDLRIIL